MQPNEQMQCLLATVLELSLARDLQTITSIVPRAVRELADTDGATFILRDGDNCFYAGENAMGPLWKGQRPPISGCISGWAIQNCKPAIVPDVYSDARISPEPYQGTFVKSLVIVPIRSAAPVGAVGIYWARTHEATIEQVHLIEAVAALVSVAMDNVTACAEAEKRCVQQSIELEAANKELEAFSYAVSHDLRAPLRAISGFSRILQEEAVDVLPAESRLTLDRIVAAAAQMQELIEDLLSLSRVTAAVVRKERVNLSSLAQNIFSKLRRNSPGRTVKLICEPEIFADADPALMEVALNQLLGNAWKFTILNPEAQIEFTTTISPEGEKVYSVRDNGVGFEMAYAQRLFQPFQRLHRTDQFPGTGIGLATVQRIVRKHGGRIWADAKPNEGATFQFTLA